MDIDCNFLNFFFTGGICKIEAVSAEEQDEVPMQINPAPHLLDLKVVLFLEINNVVQLMSENLTFKIQNYPKTGFPGVQFSDIFASLDHFLFL